MVNYFRCNCYNVIQNNHFIKFSINRCFSPEEIFLVDIFSIRKTTMQSMQKHGIIVGILFDVKSYVFTVSLRIVDIKKKYIYDNRCV